MGRGIRYDDEFKRGVVAESFKTELIKHKTYKARKLARQYVFDYIEMFYNSKRKHSNNGMFSPIGFKMTAKVQ